MAPYPGFGLSRRLFAILGLAFALLVFPIFSSVHSSVLADEAPAADAAPVDEEEASDGSEADDSEAADEDDQNVATSSVFLDAVTVASTLSERSLMDTPGQIDLVGSSEIQELGYTNVQDLVTFLPGVTVEGDLDRLGFGGFSIRGIGGNRVLTLVDGVPTAERFDFGPFSVQRFGVDVESIDSLEVVRSAGSALYGSDAIGGVVSLVTQSPRDYLLGKDQAARLRAGYDSRAEEFSGSATYARGGDTWQGSLVYTFRDGGELENQGTIDTPDRNRTVANPIDRRSDNALLKLTNTANPSGEFGLSVELFDGEANTEVFTSRAPASPFASAVLDNDAVDTQERQRISAYVQRIGTSSIADSLLVRGYFQEAETAQLTDETRLGFAGESQRDGSLSFDQSSYGANLEAAVELGSSSSVLTYGANYRFDSFEQFRDRTEFLISSGAPVPTSLIFPTKYFPDSETEELGIFAQTELSLLDGRVQLLPGVRYDRYDLDADENDQIFLNGNPGQAAPIDLSEDSVSPRLGAVVAASDKFSFFAQYAQGFRAPPMSAVNNGFTNQAGGYRTLPNGDLEPETSDNYEFGIRTQLDKVSFTLTYFDNRYDDFIETVFLGFNPFVGLVEFQPQNITDVQISGFELGGQIQWSRDWSSRFAYADIEGENRDSNEPLESIEPARLVTGLRYAPATQRWGFQLIGTFHSSKSASDLPSDSTQFRPPSAEVFDLSAWYALTNRITLSVNAWNLTDETYWIWPQVRGRSATSTTIDRYSAPGTTFGGQVRVRF